MAASDHGFGSVGIDIDAAATARIQALGYNAVQQDFMALSFEIVTEELYIIDVQAGITDAAWAIRRCRRTWCAAPARRLAGPSAPADLAREASDPWRALEAAKSNPNWADLTLHHIFTRDRVLALLRESGFEIADFTVPGRSPAQMEFYAVRKA